MVRDTFYLLASECECNVCICEDEYYIYVITTGMSQYSIILSKYYAVFLSIIVFLKLFLTQ